MKKEKSGYYITANFYKTNLTLLRFGWLEQNDWKAQKAETGQASGLDNKAYEHKLFAIAGDYLLNAPINLLKGVGKQKAKKFQDKGVITIQELLQSSSNENSSLHQQCNNLLNICNPNISPASLNFDYQEKLINNVWWWIVVENA